MIKCLLKKTYRLIFRGVFSTLSLTIFVLLPQVMVMGLLFLLSLFLLTKPTDKKEGKGETK